jgi:2-dehydro-3-deoxygalactonokinase
LSEAAYLALDWGTTHRRTYVMDPAGTVVARERDGRGVLSIPPGGYPHELAALRARFGPLPAIAAGMVGSARGWREVPYVPAPAGAAQLAAALTCIETDDLLIVPGLSLREAGRSDVMRGEEVQVLGAVVAGLAPADALFCQPGTHNKWIELEGGRIVRFTTAMTGEIFALLRDHSLLSEMLGGEVEDGHAFRDGVAAAQEEGGLLAQMFGIRAAVLLESRPRESAAAFTSGLLIGSDVASAGVQGRTIHLLADATLGPLYAVAIQLLGGRVALVDSEAAFAAGIHHIRGLSQ